MCCYASFVKTGRRSCDRQVILRGCRVVLTDIVWWSRVGACVCWCCCFESVVFSFLHCSIRVRNIAIRSLFLFPACAQEKYTLRGRCVFFLPVRTQRDDGGYGCQICCWPAARTILTLKFLVFEAGLISIFLVHDGPIFVFVRATFSPLAYVCVSCLVKFAAAGSHAVIHRLCFCFGRELTNVG